MRKDPVGDEYPCYTEEEWKRRERRHRTYALSDSVAGIAPQASSYLSDAGLAEILDALRLDPFERHVAELRLAGLTVREVAERSGIAKCRVEGAIRRIRRRVHARQCGALAPGSTGWQEVYQSEGRRRGCPRSQEAAP